MPEVRFSLDPTREPKLSTAKTKAPRGTWPEYPGMYILLDIETSGWGKANDRIISLASKAYVTERGEDGRDELVAHASPAFDELIKIEGEVNRFVSDVSHGLTDVHLSRAKGDFGVVGKLWIDWLSELTSEIADGETVVMVGHNGFSCDFRKIACELVWNALALPPRLEWSTLDTLDVIRASRYYATLKSKALSSVVNHVLRTDPRFYVDGASADQPHTFETYCGRAHDAMADVLGLAVVLKVCFLSLTHFSPYVTPDSS
tara:strand:- start:159 stop:938 length:780 start_codon:yes stop_codon:yes gene_type:complete